MKNTLSNSLTAHRYRLVVPALALIMLLMATLSPSTLGYIPEEHLIPMVMNLTSVPISGTYHYSKDDVDPKRVLPWYFLSEKGGKIGDSWINPDSRCEGFVIITVDKGFSFPFNITYLPLTGGDNPAMIDSFKLTNDSSNFMQKIPNTNTEWTVTYYGDASGFIPAPKGNSNIRVSYKSVEGNPFFELQLNDNKLPFPLLEGQWYTGGDNSPIFIEVKHDSPTLRTVTLIPGMQSNNRAPYTSLTYYRVPTGREVAGDSIRYNMPGLPFMDNGKSLTYAMSFATDGSYTLQQKNCGGFPSDAKKDPKQAASIKWWEKAKTLTPAAYVKIPDDIESITGVYTDEASQKLVYVGYDEPTDAGGNSITFIPAVALPLPVPPVYPGYGDIIPIKCYGLKSGYTLTGGENRWSNGSNKLFLKKFNYNMTKDSNGNTTLIQNNCDFTGMPDLKSVAWWKNAKVLIKKTDKNKSMDKQDNGEINLSQDVNAKFTGKNGNI